MQHFNPSSLSQLADEKRNPTSLEEPLLQDEEANEEQDQAIIDSPGAMRVRATLSQQVREITSARSDFNQIMATERRRGKFLLVGTLLSLACLVVTSYFCDKELDSTEPLGTNLSDLFFFLALLSAVSTCVTGCMSFDYCCRREDEDRGSAATIRSDPNFEEKKSTVLDISRRIGIEIRDPANPYQLEVGLQEAQQKIKEFSAQRLAFLNGSHPRLGEHSTVRTFFNELDSGGRARARNDICENIFQLAGMNPSPA